MKNSKNDAKLKSLAFSIAHEVQNPLFAIRGACEIVKNNINESLEYVDLAIASANRSLQIVDLILANINEGKIDKNNFTNLKMAEIVKMAICEYAFSDKQKELIEFDLAEDFIFHGEENLMIFVLFNLLKNALYYKAKVSISLKNGEKSNYLYFADQGPGISTDKLKSLFDDFFTNNKKDGHGLGLPFCKRVMLAFGGNISCKSVIGNGTEFILSFPKERKKIQTGLPNC